MAENGAANTKPFGEAFSGLGSLEEFGVDDKYLRLAQALGGKPREIDPAMAAFLYFSKMGELASQPGATLFGSAAGAASSPAEYMMNIREQNRKREAAVPATAINLMKALKPTASELQLSSLAKAKRDFQAGRITKEEYDALFAKLTNIPGDTSKFTARTVYKDGTEKKVYSQEDYDKAITTEGWSDTKPATDIEPSTTLAKLYQDLSNATEGSPEYEAIQKQIDAEIKKAGFAKEIFSAEKDLRSEWTKVSTPFEKVEGNHKKLKAALEKQTGVGDMSAIFMYMKMLDPGSVVRESEFSAAQQTAGVMQQVIILGNQLMKGDKLSPEQRKEFLALAETFYDVTKGYTDQKRGNLQFVLENNPTLKFSNVFGKQFPPPSFYLKQENIDAVSGSDLTMQELWKEMTDAEKREYD
jgi:hypothetical protein